MDSIHGKHVGEDRGGVRRQMFAQWPNCFFQLADEPGGFLLAQEVTPGACSGCASASSVKFLLLSCALREEKQPAAFLE